MGTEEKTQGMSNPHINWRKTIRSVGNGECIEVGATDKLLTVRDSKTPSGAILLCSSAQWQAFISRLKTKA
jgi:hypothetical protein